MIALRWLSPRWMIPQTSRSDAATGGGDVIGPQRLARGWLWTPYLAALVVAWVLAAGQGQAGHTMGGGGDCWDPNNPKLICRTNWNHDGTSTEIRLVDYFSGQRPAWFSSADSARSGWNGPQDAVDFSWTARPSLDTLTEVYCRTSVQANNNNPCPFSATVYAEPPGDIYDVNQEGIYPRG